MDTASPDQNACCPDGDCRPRTGPSRRTFLALTGTGVVAATLAGSRREAAAALGVEESCVVLVPEDKGLSPGWIASLHKRGEPTVSTGAGLRYLGMPVGGGCCGEVYLAGDGRLWNWDVLNLQAMSTSDTAYADPPLPESPFRQGFLLRTTVEGRAETWTLDADGFADVRFTGQYPIGRVEYRAAGCPVEVTLEAFSPFIPLETDDSTIPVTVLVYTIRNLSDRPVDAELLGYADSPVCLASRHERPVRLRADALAGNGARGVAFSASPGPAPGADTVFEDWSGSTYGSWTVTGTAFGPGPVGVDDLPAGMKRFGALNAGGGRLVTSYDFRGEQANPDGATGTLTSPPFTVQRDYVATRVGGGNLPGQACVNVVVDNAVVATATGQDVEPLTPVALDVSAYRGRTATVQIVDRATGAWGHVNVGAIVFTDRPDVVVEDWNRTTYAPWTATGAAFGTGPVTVDEVPTLMKRFGGFDTLGPRFVTSYDFRGDAADPDGATGTLTSPPVPIDRRYLLVRVGGGADARNTCVNVLVDGTVVATATGSDTEPMSVHAFDLAAHQGRTATIEAVDSATGGWGHVNVGTIILSDAGVADEPLDTRPDFGTFAIAALDRHATVRPSVDGTGEPASLFDAATAPAQVDGGRATLTGTVHVALRLGAHAREQARFLLGWHFPIPDRKSLAFLDDIATLRRHYAARYADATAVVTSVAREARRLEDQTRLWVRTWYEDSTLPYWFLERTLSTASTLATSTCYRFDNGRFYGWEGVYCCAGTCEHVWNYAQSVARLFPDLERDTRARVDLGIGFHADTGQMGFRAEADMTWATDGQCGTIMRIYREHQMAPDTSFLRQNWPRIKLATQYLIGHDTGRDGIIEGPQPNTLDTTWYGEIPWISGMYVGALLAAAAMADEMGDPAFAATCRARATSGTHIMSTTLWNGEYYVQHLDPQHENAINSNKGCHIDQMFGQSLAAQLGLPRIFPLDQARTALHSTYRYNFAPDPAAYRAANTDIPGGRIFALAHEPGVIMTTWPHCGAEIAPGRPASWAAMYFNECWTGQEYELAAQMIYDGDVDEGLIVTRAVHDRYAPEKRNPYNEIECGEHYARAMASHGVFLAACGFTYHGPAGRIGFAPRLSPERFAAAFTTAQGWGLYRQVRHGARHTSTLDVRHGQVSLSELSLAAPGRVRHATIRLGRRSWRPLVRTDGTTVTLTLPERVTVLDGQSLVAEIEAG